MKRWNVRDHDGREIYFTEERWEYITSKHCELIGRLNDVLDTVRLGRRRQEQRDPQTYKYYIGAMMIFRPLSIIFLWSSLFASRNCLMAE